MIRNKSISVIITTYIRYETLDDIIKSWLAEPIDQLWILDGAGKFRSKHSDSRLQIFSLPVDLGPKMDYAFALLTEGDIVVLADDDVIVKPGFTNDLLTAQERLGGIVGIIGREFKGPRYYGDTPWHGAYKLDKPQRVGFVGVVIMSPREHLGFDVRGLPRNCDDLWWLMKEKPTVPKWVVPTKNYINTDHATDDTAMCKTKSLMQERADFYRKYYLRDKVMYDKLSGVTATPSQVINIKVASKAHQIRNRMRRLQTGG